MASKANSGVVGVTGTGTGTGPAPTSPALLFVAGRGECEEKTVTLKIENFSEFLTMSNAELLEKCLIFEAGTCVLQDGTKTAAKWKYYFTHTKKDGVDCVGTYLTLGMDRSALKSAQALYSVQFSSGGNVMSFYRAGRNEYASTPDWGWVKMMTKSEFLEKTKAANELEVTLQVTVFSSQGFTPMLQESSANPSELKQMRGEVIADLEKLFESEDGADLEIKVPNEAGGEVDDSSHTKMAHKSILMARSSVFSKMFAKESTMVEAKTGKVVIKDLSPIGLEVFLNYIYTGKISDEWVKVPDEILNASEKYDCGRLKNYCGRNLMSAVTTKNALEMFHLAKLHKLSFAKSAITEFISKNTKAVLEDGDEKDGHGTE